eukprot:TRINITY_DN10521_c0_g1_i1.p1 TRINITY_DN10521_c0_g1~~TRINITY_DN10521_c0_g1_i1.p1  ORF type:complete len:362 (-),score=68.69 TRINITY_DN10521_c0_g1_i1:70-1155(-)
MKLQFIGTLILLVLFSAEAFSANKTCEVTQKCVGLNKACKPAGECSFDPEKADCCATGLHCHKDSCVADTLGEECATAADCYPASLKCDNKVCKATSGPGESCGTDVVCMYGNCTSGSCTSLKKGDKCDLTKSMCGFDLYCSTGDNGTVCKQKIGFGEKCSATDICSLYSTCLGGVCVEYFSVKKDESCNAPGQTSLMCAPGLYCNTKGKCAEGDTKPFVQTCEKDSDCAKKEGWVCQDECNPIAGEKFCIPGTNATQQILCSKEQASVFDCLNSKGCSSSSNIKGTCGNKCNGNLQSYQACLCTASQASKYNSCAYYSSCSNAFPAWSIVLIIVGALLVVVLVVVALAKACRGNSYQSIG